MNNSIETGGILTERVNGISYFVGISVGIIFLIAIIAIASSYCNEALTTPATAQSTTNPQENPSIAVKIGLDETTLQTYPSFLYSKAKVKNKDTATSCSVCLSDYKNSDELRQLPDCEHIFHLKCVDPWLRLHPTYPVCRSTPTPSPLSTPLAEVVPLSRIQV